MKKRLSEKEYVQGVLDGNRVVLSRAITLVESTLSEDQALAQKVIQAILPHVGKSVRIGITGVPGVGKSTFIECFGEMMLDMGYKLAVLAIDPSSSKSHGSILGDKTRMEQLASDKRAYIRPTPSGTALGGVSARTRETMLLCEAAGFDMILIETVGVGQSETAVRGMVDFFLLLMLAGAGDELQGIKKGIMEMCDALVINKADGENLEMAKRASRDYSNALHLFAAQEHGWVPQVKICSSINGAGLREIWKMIHDYQDQMVRNGYWETQREEQRVNWMHEHIRYLLEASFYQNADVRESMEKDLSALRSGLLSPIAKAQALVGEFAKKHR